MRRTAFILAFAAGCAGCDHTPPVVQPSVADTGDASLTKPERDSIRQQIEQTWRIDPDISDLDKMRVVVVVDLNRDGSV